MMAICVCRIRKSKNALVVAAVSPHAFDQPGYDGLKFASRSSQALGRFLAVAFHIIHDKRLGVDEFLRDVRDVSGNLEMHGITKNITFPAELELDGDTLTTAAEFTIKRFDWDIVYSGKVDDLIHDEVLIAFEVEAVKASEDE